MVFPKDHWEFLRKWKGFWEKRCLYVHHKLSIMIIWGILLKSSQ